jgi:hypothetical protein
MLMLSGPSLSLFDLPHDPDCPPRPLLPRFPLGGLGLLAGVLAVVIAGEQLAGMPHAVIPVAGVAVGHGALLMVAFANADAGWRRPTLVVVSLLAAAAALARAGPVGALAYLLVPAAVWHLARRRAGLGAMGITTPVSLRAALVGLLSGLSLGGHLLISASRTLGYEIGGFAVGTYLVAVAYDVGANVVSAECFFRGTLFDGVQRRSTFWLATALSTLAEVLRYVIDPSLPKSVESIAGAVFYMAVLGMGNCALFRWSGSLIPGALGRLGFFAAYRSVSGW